VDGSFRVCTPAVVSEVIDGEAIIMDLRSGNYFSADGAGALVWEALAQGCGRSAILSWAEAAFDAPADAVASGVDAFIAQLVEHGLIEASETVNGAVVPPNAVARRPFAAPTLEVYTDMQDLLLLDPIHDVDEAGWPTRKVDEPQV
jgi:hypothetical protein